MSRYHLKVKPQYPLRTELLNLGKESNCDQVFSFFFFQWTKTWPSFNKCPLACGSGENTESQKQMSNKLHKDLRNINCGLCSTVIITRTWITPE